MNIWMIDYSPVSAGPAECYLAAVLNLPAVGKCAAQFVSHVIELSEVDDPEDAMHVIGFSLGGQLAGQVAEHLQPVKLPRITGAYVIVYFLYYVGPKLKSRTPKRVLLGQTLPICFGKNYFINLITNPRSFYALQRLTTIRESSFREPLNLKPRSMTKLSSEAPTLSGYAWNI